MKNAILLHVLLSYFPVVLTAQEISDRKIDFPDIPGYQTLVCDLHQHTVFSDGNVWPTIRVEEALKDGLDAIAVTEHLEYQPHQSDIPHPDRNRAFEIESGSAGDRLLVIPGSEITRGMPPGHANAIFIEDANKLLLDDPVAVFEEANKQGAFVFWNHPNWTRQYSDGIAKLAPLHRDLIERKLLHGIEVVNDVTVSEEALAIALQHDLTILGTSDIHGLIDWQYEIPKGGHRPVTLVFSQYRTAASLREALVEGRTVVWFRNILIGRSEWVMPLVKASIIIERATYLDNTQVAEVTIRNQSDAQYILRNKSTYSFHGNTDVITLAPGTTTTLLLKTRQLVDQVSLEFELLNCLIGPKVHPDLTIEIPID